MSAHTAWRVCGDAGDWSASHDGIGSSEYQAIKEGDEVVALVVSHASSLFQPPPDTSPRANLIAAAPDLLEALEDLLHEAKEMRAQLAANCLPTSYAQLEAFDAASAAIAKATPEAKP